MASIVKRTTFIIRDMARSLVFYRDVLGLALHYDHELTMTGNMMPGVMPGDLVRLVMVRGVDPVIGMIGLIEWLEPRRDAPSPKHEIGFDTSIFVVSVDDVAAVYARAQEHGFHTSCAPLDSTYPGADGNPVHVRGFGVFDADGHFFECNQTLN